jgi:plastocyanin
MRLPPGRTMGAVLGCALLLASTSAQQAPREINAFVGAGQDTVNVNAFFPNVLRVSVGDTVTWWNNTDELHTVTFGPETAFIVGGATGPMVNPRAVFPTRRDGAPVETYGGTGLVNSGIMSRAGFGDGAPAIDAFSLTFDRPGTFSYHCIIHETFMTGTVTVEAAGSQGLPSDDEIALQVRVESTPLLARLDRARMSAIGRREVGPNDATFVYVNAGVVVAGDPRAELLEFLPKDVTIRSGDTVIWGSPGFHTITFTPVPPMPQWYRNEREGPRTVIYVNMDVASRSKPSALYDPSRFFNSGFVGFLSNLGSSWALTFDEPGIFEYACGIHGSLGMEGVITVIAR